MSLTLIKLAVKDPATDDQVILSNIREGVDGAADMGWAEEEQNVQIEDNQRLEHSTEGTLDVKVLRGTTAEVSQLNNFIGKRCEVSGWTIEGFLLFSEQNRIVRVPDFNSDILNDQIRLTQTTPKGFRSGVRAFYGGRNAVMLHDIRSHSGAANSQLFSGFSKEGAPDTNVTGIEKTVTGDLDEGVVSAKLYFPFEGAKLVASAQIANSPDDGAVGLRFLSHNDTILSTSTSNFTTGGRRSHEATVPSGTYYIQFIALVKESLEGSFTLSLPAIKTMNTQFED